MTYLRKRAEDYAKDAILRLREYLITTEDKVEEAIVDAYEQGYIESDTKDDKPETLAELLNEAPDCRYFREGYCSKDVNDIFCFKEDCAAYCPKEDANNAQKRRK